MHHSLPASASLAHCLHFLPRTPLSERWASPWDPSPESRWWPLGVPIPCSAGPAPPAGPPWAATARARRGAAEGRSWPRLERRCPAAHGGLCQKYQPSLYEQVPLLLYFFFPTSVNYLLKKWAIIQTVNDEGLPLELLKLPFSIWVKIHIYIYIWNTAGYGRESRADVSRPKWTCIQCLLKWEVETPMQHEGTWSVHWFPKTPLCITPKTQLSSLAGCFPQRWTGVVIPLHGLKSRSYIRLVLYIAVRRNSAASFSHIVWANTSWVKVSEEASPSRGRRIFWINPPKTLESRGLNFKGWDTGCRRRVGSHAGG